MEQYLLMKPTYICIYKLLKVTYLRGRDQLMYAT